MIIDFKVNGFIQIQHCCISKLLQCFSNDYVFETMCIYEEKNYANFKFIKKCLTFHITNKLNLHILLF